MLFNNLPGHLDYTVQYDGFFRYADLEADEFDGDVESPTGHFSRYSLTMADLVYWMRTSPDTFRYVEDKEVPPPGDYITMTDDHGLIFVWTSDHETVLAAYADAQDQYNGWLEATEEV